MAKKRISNSFSPEEIEILDFTFNTLLRGGDPKVVIRKKGFPGLLKKVADMKKRSELSEERAKAPGQESVPRP